MSGAGVSTTTKLKHVWRSGVDQGGVSTAINKAIAYPAKLDITSNSINCEQRTESSSRAAVYQQQSARQVPLSHRPADISNIASTSVYQQWAAEPKTRLAHTAASIRGVHYPRSAKRMSAATSERIM